MKDEIDDVTKRKKEYFEKKDTALNESEGTEHITIKNTINKITARITNLTGRAFDCTYVYFSDGVVMPMFLESGPGSDSGVDGPIDWEGERGEENRRDGGSG